MKLSIVIPVYNEKNTILEIIKIVKNVSLPTEITEREIILVDDCSKDGTRDILKNINDPEIRIFYHEKNMGKGGALNTGFKKTTGDFVIIQDADLEYDPNEYSKLLRPILNDKADVVFGSRYIGGESHRILYFWHTMMNKFLTFLSNAFSDLNLTDMETCYKVFRKEVLDQITIEENRFGFEPEITAKVGELSRKKNVRIYEVGISYYGRTYDEGKKIGWKDGLRALWCIFKYNNHGFASFIKYGLNGILVALSQFIFIYILVEYFQFNSIPKENIANIISIELATLVAFFLHSFITWRQKFENFISFLNKIVYFHVVNAITIISRIFIFYLLANLGVDYKMNTAIGIVLLIVMNYLAYDRLVFREEKKVTRGNGILEKFLSERRARMASSLISRELREGKILDIGCGTFPFFLSFVKFKEKFGIEKDLKEKDAKHKNINIFEADIEREKLPFADNSFETVTMLAAIEHLHPENLPAVLNEIQRVLKPEGAFIFTTPAKWTENILRFMSKIGLVSKEEINEHKDQYTHKKLTEILIKVGYKQENIKLGYFEFFMNIYGKVKK